MRSGNRRRAGWRQRCARPVWSSAVPACWMSSDAVHAELSGAGPLQALLADPDVTDVLVNGPGQRLGRPWLRAVPRVPLELGTAADVRRLAVRLAAVAGRRLDDAWPWVDARLPDGARLHAVLPPSSTARRALSACASRGAGRFTLAELVRPALPSAWERGAARRWCSTPSGVLVIGRHRRSGKTTLLSRLLAHRARRRASWSSRTPPSCASTIRTWSGWRVAPPTRRRRRVSCASWSGRPCGCADRLVVGEVRGAEVRDLLAALNTGHEGGCGTVHANAARTCRLGWRRSARSRAWTARRGGSGGQRDRGGRSHPSPGGQRWITEVAAVLPGPQCDGRAAGADS